MTDHPEHPIADSVRLALAGEADGIAAIQRRSWGERLPAEAAEQLLAGSSLEEMAELWRQAINRPPEARFRVLVAIGDEQLVGFATTTPSLDGDADLQADGAIDEFVIDRPAQRRGHGSRLLNACADTLRADGFRRARYWVSSTDDITRGFFTGAGWAPDSAHREIGTEDGSLRLKQVRLHTDITESGDPTTN
ncbi:GNAT family N-acetyltransferase [Microlunatus soli]|uniref:L-amino acid N-acyltransferase YncA n=1 Tax=Microlunatus soli TaxID=630515 RepID=A0A1H1NR92_9ACTN|nr:GNAT family N-acetyltransferase [Microlunatus soli]SDS00859.1 L-amino acid N-acyltransferase YncA [Microlunatus soli]